MSRFLLPRHWILLASLLPGAALGGRCLAQNLTAVATRGSHAAAHEKIDRALLTQTEFDFVDTRLGEVRDYLQKKHQINVLLDLKALEEVGIATDTSLTVQLSNMTLESALRHMLAPLELTFFVGNEALVITTPEEAESQMETRVYRVEDLASREDNLVVYATSLEKYVEKYVEKHYLLIKVIQESCGIPDPGWVEEGGMGTVAAMSALGVLVVSTTRPVHQEIEDLLTALRKARTPPEVHAKAVDKGGMIIKVYKVSQPLPAQRRKDDTKQSRPPTPSRPSPEAVADAIVRMIEPGSWKAAGGKGEICAMGDSIVVRQTRGVHEQVHRFLSDPFGNHQ